MSWFSELHRAENAMIHNDLELGLNPDFLMKEGGPCAATHVCAAAKLAVCNILLHFFLFLKSCVRPHCANFATSRAFLRKCAWVAVHRSSAGRSCAALVMSHSRPFRPTFSFRSQFHVTSSWPMQKWRRKSSQDFCSANFLHVKYVESNHNVWKSSKMSQFNLNLK